MYGMVIVLASSWVRKRLGTVWWRRLHLLAVPMFTLSLLHGLFAGSDSGRTWMFAPVYRHRAHHVVPRDRPRADGGLPTDPRTARAEGTRRRRIAVDTFRGTRGPTVTANQTTLRMHARQAVTAMATTISMPDPP